jgi:hypothetical protein
LVAVTRTSENFCSTAGEVFLIPTKDGEYILAQVGFGGDLGVFDGIYSIDVDVDALHPPLLFRVQFGRVSRREFRWISFGMRPYKDTLQKSQAYVYRAIGSDHCILLKYGADDTPISATDAKQYEPLATWSHQHILNRFREQRMR